MLDPATRAAVITTAAQQSLEILEPLSSREGVVNLLKATGKDGWLVVVDALDWAGLPCPVFSKDTKP
jgi:hypothetical protein